MASLKRKHSVQYDAEDADDQQRPVKRAKVAFIYFGSGVKLRVLSNFSGDPREDKKHNFDLKDITPAMERVCPEVRRWLTQLGPHVHVPTSEHLWQALSKAGDLETFGLLLRGGWGSDLEEVFPLDPVVRAKKIHHWRVKTVDLVGILAKMAVNAKTSRRLGLNLRPGRAEGEFNPLDDLLEQVWDDILDWKMRTRPDAAHALRQTGDLLLVEFCRQAAKKEEGAATKVFWGGYYDEMQGRVLGANFMGKAMMRARARLLNQQHPQ